MTDHVSAKPDDVTEMLATIGSLIIAMQITERAIGTGLALALPEGGVHSFTALTKEIATNSRSTIGALVKKLEKRVNLSDDFAEILAAFLQGRNDLVHDVSRIPGFGWQTEGEVLAARRFLQNLLENMEAVTKVFVSLLAEWSESAGYRKDEEQVRAYLGDWHGVSATVFFSKSGED